MTIEHAQNDAVDRRNLRGYAVITAVSRDVFGYLLIGVGFWLLVVLRFSGRFAGFDMPEAVPAVLFATALGYPTGRLFAEIGRRIVERNPDHRWGSVYRRAFEDAAILNRLNGLEVLGQRVDRYNAHALLGKWGDRWTFLVRPDLFYLYNTRTKTLRLLAEATLGLVVVLTVTLTLSFAAVPLGGAGGWLGAAACLVIGGAACLLLYVQAADLREDHAETQLISNALVLTQVPLRADASIGPGGAAVGGAARDPAGAPAPREFIPDDEANKVPAT